MGLQTLRHEKVLPTTQHCDDKVAGNEHTIPNTILSSLPNSGHWRDKVTSNKHALLSNILSFLPYSKINSKFSRQATLLKCLSDNVKTLDRIFLQVTLRHFKTTIYNNIQFITSQYLTKQNITYSLFILVNITEGKIICFYEVKLVKHIVQKNFPFVVTLKKA